MHNKAGPTVLLQTACAFAIRERNDACATRNSKKFVFVAIRKFAVLSGHSEQHSKSRFIPPEYTNLPLGSQILDSQLPIPKFSQLQRPAQLTPADQAANLEAIKIAVCLLKCPWPSLPITKDVHFYTRSVLAITHERKCRTDDEDRTLVVAKAVFSIISN